MDYATGGQLNLAHKVQIKPPILRKRNGKSRCAFCFMFYNFECIWYLNNIIFLLLQIPYDINIIILLASMRIYYNIIRQDGVKCR